MATEIPNFDFESYESQDGLRERGIYVLAEHLLEGVESTYSPEEDSYSTFTMADEGQIDAVKQAAHERGALPEDSEVSSVNIASQKYDVSDGGVKFHEVTVRVAGAVTATEFTFNLQGEPVGTTDEYSNVPAIQRTTERLYDKESPDEMLRKARQIEAETGVSIAEQARLNATPSKADLEFLADTLWIMQH